MTGPLVTALFGMLVSLRVAQLIRLGIQKVVECLLNRAADHLVQMALNLRLVNPDDFAQGFRLLCRFFS
jgi:hypothetical protein